MEPSTPAFALITTAAATGFLGSAHCIGMCGGISSVVAMSDGRGVSSQPIRFTRALAPVVTLNLIAFNSGRLVSYAVAGAVVGAVGSGIINAGSGAVVAMDSTRQALFVLANLFIILTGFSIMGAAQTLQPLERIGGWLWQRLRPLSTAMQQWLPIRSPIQAGLLGLVWGWTPCGMVYAMLFGAMASGSSAQGAATMLAFGFGTLPAMLFTGVAAVSLRAWTQKPSARRWIGIAIISMGLLGLVRALAAPSWDATKALHTLSAVCTQWIAQTPLRTGFQR